MELSSLLIRDNIELVHVYIVQTHFNFNENFYSYKYEYT